MQDLAFKQLRLASVPLLALGPLSGWLAPPPLAACAWAVTLATAAAWCQWVVRSLLRAARHPD